MSRTIDGVVTIVQEGRLHLTDDRGVAHLFILGHAAAAETDQLAALQDRQARIRVHYTPAPGLIVRIASATELA